MDHDAALLLVKKLEFDKEYTVYSEDGISIGIYRPSKLSGRFAKYDISKNFYIWLQTGSEKFRPNHFRVLIDLNLRVRSRPDLKEDLLRSFDSIYYGSDPFDAVKELQEENFKFYLNDIIVIGILHQLLLIEQEYSYYRESKFDPSTLFLQGWIREFIDSPKEIDNMCMSVAHGQPPLAKYVSLENRKNKHYVDNLSELWYLQ